MTHGEGCVIPETARHRKLLLQIVSVSGVGLKEINQRSGHGFPAPAGSNPSSIVTTPNRNRLILPAVSSDDVLVVLRRGSDIKIPFSSIIPHTFPSPNKP